jgi:outer membrane protein assembly factor BamA
VALSRRNLYDTRAFALVDIRTEEIQTPPATEREQPMRLEVSVREVRPFELRYGGSYDTERGVGLLTNIENRNTLGKARVLGARARYDGETREGRLYFSQPLLRNIPIETSVVGFGRRDIDNAAGFTTQRLGVSLQQEIKLKDFYVLSYGYRFERTRTMDHDPSGFGDLSINLAPLSATLTRDTRDDLLDASRGSFNAHAFEYAPSLLGSQLRYIRYFGQYFKYIPLQRPREVPWSGGDQKARLVYAGAIRVGLAQGLGGQELIPGERFFAGGESTVRGFRKDALGPIDVAGFAKGGEAVFIFNNELRFPVISIFDGVGFVDIGNVYENVSDFNPFDVRGAAGFGLRVRTPYFLLRADYGMKLSRREGESAGAFFFSIGQAF